MGKEIKIAESEFDSAVSKCGKAASGLSGPALHLPHTKTTAPGSGAYEDAARNLQTLLKQYAGTTSADVKVLKQTGKALRQADGNASKLMK